MLLTKLARRGPFTAQPGEAWVDAGLAERRERELLGVISDLVSQFAGRTSDGMLDSMALSALEDAMHVLDDAGLFEIDGALGRRVIGRLAIKP